MQKEAAGIVNSMIQAAQSNYALFAGLPNIWEKYQIFLNFKNVMKIMLI